MTEVASVRDINGKIFWLFTSRCTDHKWYATRAAVRRAIALPGGLLHLVHVEASWRRASCAVHDDTHDRELQLGCHVFKGKARLTIKRWARGSND